MKRKIVDVLSALVVVVTLVLTIAPLSGVSAATNTRTFMESGTFIVPETVTRITVEAWGGGGAGGGSTNAGGGSARGGGGGGGGAYAGSIVIVEPGQELQVVVGPGGSGVSGADGYAGGPSFAGPNTNPDDALVRASGGSGGAGNTAGGSPAGGVGGTIAGSLGDTRIGGANGGDGATGKGCSSGTGGNGANGGGSGGAALTGGSANGNVGGTPGGGGGGSRTQANGGLYAGGGGAAGKVVIAWVTYDLTVSGTEGGGVTTPGEGVFTYGKGAVINLAATPDAGYEFVEWTGDVGTIADIYAAATDIVINDDYAITANFEVIPVVQHDLITSSLEGGSVTIPGEGVFTYDEGTIIDLVAIPDAGYQFDEWTGDVGTIANVKAAGTNIAMNGDYSIIANFAEVPPPVYPTVTTHGATGVTTNSTTVNMGYIVGDFSPVEVCFAYKKSTDSAWAHSAWVSKTADGTHADVVTGLDSDTTYEFAAQLKYNNTVIEGTTLQFTTGKPSTPPPWGSGGGCFIATAAYGTPSAKQIDILRDFRDDVLLKNTAGSQFVALYYRLSPPIADFIAGNGFVRTLVRELLIDPIVWIVEATGDVWQN